AVAPDPAGTGGDAGTAHDDAPSHHRHDGGGPTPAGAAPVAAQQVPMAGAPPATPPTTPPASQDVVAPVAAAAPAPAAAATAVTAPTTLTAPEAPQAPAPVVHAPVVATPAAQLAPRIGALRSLGEGVHRLVMRVQPEEIGAVRVVAEISADRVRIELHGGTEQAREALRAALPELRRDLLQGSGFQLGGQHASAQDQRGSGPQAQLDLGGSGGGSGSGRGERPGTPSAPVAAPVELVLPRVAPGRLDVLT
ncbi:flagellar hook-length control protein FliK, partial [Angustibacter speluncae]